MQKLLRLIVLVLLIPAFVFADDYDNAAQTGTDLGNTINQQYGTSSGVNDNLSKPLTSNSSKLNPLTSTVYQCSITSKVYNTLVQCSSACIGACVPGVDAQMSFPSSSVFLTLNALPVTGGDVQIFFDQDSNWDGTADWHYSIPQIASGVCANGIISCTPGTWTNCQYYKWATTAGMHVTLAAVADPRTMGGCYAINNSAGSGLFVNNITTVLNNLGGGVIGAIQTSDPHYIITQANVDASNMRINYYGQYSQSASPMPGTVPQSGPPNPQSLYGNAAALSGMGTTQFTAESTTPGTLGNLMTNSQASGSNISYEMCSIQNDLTFTVGPGPSETANFGTVSDNCGPYLSCRLFQEQICNRGEAQCVNTYTNGLPTNLTPYPSCSTVTSLLDTYVACASGSLMAIQSNTTGTITNVATGTGIWWRINRTYACTTTNPATTYTIPDTRTGSIQSSIDDTNPLSVTYQDNISGSPQNGTISLHSSAQTYDNCEKVCKVRANASTSGVSVNQGNQSTVQNTYLTNNTADKEVFRSCKLVSGTWTCPTEAGEVITTNCGCINEFPKAAAAISTVKEASKDMICVP